eukprot:1115222-Amphidinium_carterae.1
MELLQRLWSREILCLDARVSTWRSLLVFCWGDPRAVALEGIGIGAHQYHSVWQTLEQLKEVWVAPNRGAMATVIN